MQRMPLRTTIGLAEGMSIAGRSSIRVVHMGKAAACTGAPLTFAVGTRWVPLAT